MAVESLFAWRLQPKAQKPRTNATPVSNLYMGFELVFLPTYKSFFTGLVQSGLKTVWRKRIWGC